VRSGGRLIWICGLELALDSLEWMWIVGLLMELPRGSSLRLLELGGFG